MPAFVLAHLSDPHLAPLPLPGISELALKRILGFLNWHRARRRRHRSPVLAAIVRDLQFRMPDHVAVTGDLVNISLAREFAAARAWLEALGPARDVSVVPGNHDAYVRAAADEAFRHWGAYMQGDAGPAAVGTAFPYLRRRGAIALIGVSSALPTGPLMATGRVGDAQLGRLAELLERLARDRLFRIVMIHHPPLPSPGRHLKRLVDSRAFCDVLARHGAELVLYGHDHVHAEHWLEGPDRRIAAIGVPSASAAREAAAHPAAYNLYSIEGGPGAWRCEALSRGLGQAGEEIVDLKRWTIARG